MGCGNSKTAEIRKPCSSKYSYPECYYTYQSNQPITSITSIDSTHLLFGTKGEIVADMEGKISLYSFADKKTRTIKYTGPGQELASGHGGGDSGIMEDAYEYFNGGTPSESVSGIENSYLNHLTCFAAEESRFTDTVVKLEEFSEKI